MAPTDESKGWLSSLKKKFDFCNRALVALNTFLLMVALVGPQVVSFPVAPEVAYGLCLAALASISTNTIIILFQNDALKAMLERQGAKTVFALDDAVSDLFEALERAPTSEPITINVVALHFKNMFRWFAPALRKSKLRSVNIQLLLVTPDIDRLGSVIPNEVAEASRSMSSEIRPKHDAFEALLQELRDDHSKIVNIEIRHYEMVPPLLGFHVQKPIDSTYIHICRFHYIVPDSEYYHRVTHASSSPADDDIRSAFRILFKQLWNSAPKEHRWQSSGFGKRGGKKKSTLSYGQLSVESETEIPKEAGDSIRQAEPPAS